MGTKTVGSVLLILIVVMSAVIGVATLVQTVPTESVPALLVPVWDYIVGFFIAAEVLTAVAFARNFFGFIQNYFKQNYSEQYDFKKLGETLAVYMGVIASIIAAISPIRDIVPAPYNDYLSATLAVGAAVIVVLDLIKKQLAELGQKILD